jgi:hypothetical protein
LVIVFTPVDNSGYRRIGIRRNLYEVKSGFFGSAEGFGSGNDAKLSAIFSYNAQAG